MTFAADVKKECTLLEVHHEHAKAELAALIKMNGALSIYQRQFVLNIQSENAAIARRIYLLLKNHFQTEAELLVRRKMKLKKNNVYIVRCRHHVIDILDELQIYKDGQIITEVDPIIMADQQKARSYLRGAFLAGGSVNNPESSNYHLEIYSNYEGHNQNICQMMNLFDLNARTVVRRNGYISYIKEAEKIADFLSVIGASSAMFEFEDIRIVRDMRNSVNRLMNMENANINKTVDAAQKQVEAIRLIEETIGLSSLPEKLEEIARFRLANPEMSLKEIGEQVPGGPISKSGVNHRFRKLTKIAANL
ncbi:DNA-binding protein WhiA [Eremococcus coleocola]|uniref:Probable cell division protein WhiA n=1 Tax=Eremococcus coleocola ACS-139-V-Col8 TaxID=908337 RepID=E4KMV7_9LACT|nr:DNA-binding protein WhiA [Eremococcus coleocola]EFR31780.1 hypothetical protein HMPREF9257_0170 [Eremococcus coleocola ACS-139-V-Col8]